MHINNNVNILPMLTGIWALLKRTKYETKMDVQDEDILIWLMKIIFQQLFCTWLKLE